MEVKGELSKFHASSSKSLGICQVNRGPVSANLSASCDFYGVHTRVMMGAGFSSA